MGIVEQLLKRNPYIEVGGRIFYSKVRDSKLGIFVKSKLLKINETGNAVEYSNVCNEFFQFLGNRLGIEKGDILIVHSSMEGLKSLGADVKEIIDQLLNLVGEEGTLVIPTFPKYNKKKTYNGESIDIYDVKRTLCWTGMLPNIFLRYKDVIRSEFPYCTLAAKGYYANEMMKHTWESDVAQGKNSAWGFCAEHHAKVLFLGVKAFHSITESHMVEDYLDSKWPIREWYENKKYCIITSNKEEKIVSIRQRKNNWAKFIPEYYNESMLELNGDIINVNYNNIDISFIPDLYDFNQMKIKNALNGKIDYRIPKKYWKQCPKRNN